MGEVPQPAGHPVPGHGVANRTAHHKADSWLLWRDGVIGPRREEKVSDERPAAGTATLFDRRREVLGAVQSMLSGEHAGGRGTQRSRLEPGRAQADRLERPLRRRVDKIARPALVRIRSRKPWVLARRRLFGWKVRLLTGCSSTGRVVQMQGGSGAQVCGVAFDLH
jgi:hypothetical protein